MDITIFDKYVGLKELNPSPTPEDYVNTISNIDQKLIDLLKQDEAGNIQTVWDDVKTNTIQAMDLCLRSKMCKLADYDPIIDESNESWINSDTLTESDNLKYKGVLINAQNIKNASITFSKLSFCSIGAIGTSVFKVFNAITGTELYTQSITGISGFNSIDLSFTKQMTFGDGLYYACIIIKDTSDGLAQLEQAQSTKGVLKFSSGIVATSTTAKKENIEIVDENFLNIGVSISYDFMKLVAQNAERLALPFKQYAGAELLERCLKSKRASQVTLINRDEQRFLIEDLKKESYKGIEQVATTLYKTLKAVPSVLQKDERTRAGNFLGSMV